MKQMFNFLAKKKKKQLLGQILSHPLLEAGIKVQTDLQASSQRGADKQYDSPSKLVGAIFAA